MSQTLADDSEVVFDQLGEGAGAMETEGPLQSRHREGNVVRGHGTLPGGPTQNDGFRPTGRQRAGGHLGGSGG